MPSDCATVEVEYIERIGGPILKQTCNGKMALLELLNRLEHEPNTLYIVRFWGKVKMPIHFKMHPSCFIRWISEKTLHPLAQKTS